MFRMLCIAMLLTAGAVHAQTQRGFYVALEAGKLSAKPTPDKGGQDDALAAGGATNINSEMKQGATPLGIALGYNLHQLFGFELDFKPGIGLNNYIATYDQGILRGTTEKSWHAKYSFGLAAVGRFPIWGPLALTGKAGVRSMKGDFQSNTVLRTQAGSQVSSTSENASGSAMVPDLGIGLSFIAIPDLITVRAMYERLGSKSGMFGAGNDVNNIRMISLGLIYQL